MTMTPTCITVDCSTGRAAERPMSDAEVAKVAENRAAALAAEAEPAPPTDMERLVAVLVEKVDTFTEADAAKALGVKVERVTAAAEKLAAEAVALEAAPIKGAVK